MNRSLKKLGLRLTVPSLLFGLIGLSGAATVDARDLLSKTDKSDRPGAQMQVVDSKKNDDLLIISSQTKEGKVWVESAPSYTSPARAGKPVRTGTWVDVTVAATP
jgi:hypothetical protein